MALFIIFVVLFGVDLQSEDVELAARREAERKVLLIDGIQLERPYLSISVKLETVMEYERAKDNEILRFHDMVHYVFPISQHGEIIGDVAILRTDTVVSFSGRGASVRNEVLEFLALRDNLAPDKDLVWLSVGYTGFFAVAHKDFVATEVYPIDKSAWEALTGFRPEKWSVGEPQTIDVAGPKIKSTARFWREFWKARLEERSQGNGNEQSN